jgi:hypothetical protein
MLSRPDIKSSATNEVDACGNKTVINSPLRAFSIFGTADVNVASNSIQKQGRQPENEAGAAIGSCLGPLISLIMKVL